MVHLSEARLYDLAMQAIAVSREHWPLVLVRYVASPASDDDVDLYLEELAANFDRGSRYAIVTDASRQGYLFSLEQRTRVNRWLGDHRDQIIKWSTGNAVVVSSSPLIRGVLAAFYRHFHHYPRKMHNVVGSYAEGVDWALQRLVAASVIDAKGAEQRREAALRWSPPVQPEEPPVAAPAPTIGPYAPLVEMFDEPVFLVTPAGDLVHANRAATSRYPEPPAWLPRTVALTDTGDAEEPPPCRVSDIETGDGDRLYLVIPERGSSPDPGLSLAELPPSLRRVARLLADGLSDKEIAEACGLSFATVRTYVTRIFKRMGVHNRTELAARLRG
jgi:DNA-binding CsgD family transcriptional regulator